jgi:HK97 gp10 family phage protein
MIIGAKEAQEFFRKLPLEFQDRVMKAAHTAALKPMRERAAQLAPEGPAKQRQRAKQPRKKLKESIKTVSGGSLRRTGEVGLVRTGALRRSPYRAYHAGFVEFGTGPRKPGGWYADMIKRGSLLKQWKKPKMPAKPFMGPAIEQTRDQVRASVSSFVDKKTIALMKRLLKKAA